MNQQEDGILFAVITVLSWGTWLAPSQTVPFKNKQIKTFYVALANLILAFSVGLFQGFHHLTLNSFWFPFAQLNVALNALFGIFIFKQPHPRSQAAFFTIIGIFIALVGAIVLGSLK
jgi:glucose uptake protein GlcU